MIRSLVLLICLLASPLMAADVNLYYLHDSRDFQTAQVEWISVGDLPMGLTSYGFADFHHDDDDSRDWFIRAQLAGEIYRGIGVEAEYDSIYSDAFDHDVLRAGPVYQHKVGTGWLRWKALLVDTDSSEGKLAVAWWLPVHRRVTLEGFADFHIEQNVWVAEPAVAVKLTKRVDWYTELRINEFETDEWGVATGIRVALW